MSLLMALYIVAFKPSVPSKREMSVPTSYSFRLSGLILKLLTSSSDRYPVTPLYVSPKETFSPTENKDGEVYPEKILYAAGSSPACP